MRKYDIPLKIVAGEIDFERIVVAHKLFDGMAEEELREPAPVDRETLTSFLRSRDTITAEECFEELLDMDGEERIAAIDVEQEVEEIPKNYDVAIALASERNMAEVRRLMDFLVEREKAKAPLAVEIIEEFEDLSPEEIDGLLGASDDVTVECAHCGEFIDSTKRLSVHIRGRHPDQVNWKRGEEVHVGIFKTLAEFPDYDAKEEVRERLSRASRYSSDAWEEFIPNPRRFLSEYGLPQEGLTKRDLQGTVGFGATSGIKRADVVFLDFDAERTVIVENKSKMTEDAFDQVQTYAGLIQDDYPFLETPRAVVNFHSRGLLMGTGTKQHTATVDGVRGSYIIGHDIHIINTPPNLTVFDLPTELQEYMDVTHHYNHRADVA